MAETQKNRLEDGEKVPGEETTLNIKYTGHLTMRHYTLLADMLYPVLGERVELTVKVFK